MTLYTITYKIFRKITYLLHNLWMFLEKKQLGACGKDVVILYPNRLSHRMFIGNNVNIYEHGLFIIGPGGKFIMKDRSGCAQYLTVITGRHGHLPGRWSKDVMMERLDDTETTITVEEDVRIGAHVTLLPGVTLGRGCQVGAGSIVTKDVAPYSIVAGNPARHIRFIFTPEEIIEHEKKLYPEEERLSYEAIKNIQA